jgi:hypothetical protein
MYGIKNRKQYQSGEGQEQKDRHSGYGIPGPHLPADGCLFYLSDH